MFKESESEQDREAKPIQMTIAVLALPTRVRTIKKLFNSIKNQWSDRNWIALWRAILWWSKPSPLVSPDWVWLPSPRSLPAFYPHLEPFDNNIRYLATLIHSKWQMERGERDLWKEREDRRGRKGSQDRIKAEISAWLIWSLDDL